MAHRRVILNEIVDEMVTGKYNGYRMNLQFGHVNPFLYPGKGDSGMYSGFNWGQLRLMGLYTGRYTHRGTKLEVLIAVLTTSFLQTLMRFEIFRKLSFDQWDYRGKYCVMQDAMAEGGFYLQASYKEKYDHCIRCCWCQASVYAMMLSDEVVGRLYVSSTPAEIMKRQGLIHKNGCLFFVENWKYCVIMETDALQIGELKTVYKSTICENFGVYKKNADYVLYMDTLPERLNTFVERGWPLGTDFKDFVHLANAGFGYTGFRDSVMCIVCKGQLRGWNFNYNPFLEHKRWFPDCTFIQNSRDYLTESIFSEGDKIMYPRKLPEPFSLSAAAAGCSTTTKALTCLICMENQREVINMPCMHYVCCSRCIIVGGSVSSSSVNKCSICREAIKYFIPVYLS